MTSYVGAVASGATLNEALEALSVAMSGNSPVFQTQTEDGMLSFASAGQHARYSPIDGKGTRAMSKSVGMLAVASAQSQSVEATIKKCNGCFHISVATSDKLLDRCNACGSPHLYSVDNVATAAVFAGEPIVAYHMATASGAMPPAVSKSYYDHPDFPLFSSILKKHANRKLDADLSKIVAQILKGYKTGKESEWIFGERLVLDLYKELNSLEQAALNGGMTSETLAHKKGKGKAVALKPVPWKDTLSVQAIYSYFRALGGLTYYTEKSEKHTLGRIASNEAFYKDAKKKHAPISFVGLKEGLASGDSVATETTPEEVKPKRTRKVAEPPQPAQPETTTPAEVKPKRTRKAAEPKADNDTPVTFADQIAALPLSAGSTAEVNEVLSNLEAVIAPRGYVKVQKDLLAKARSIAERCATSTWLDGGKAKGVAAFKKFLNTGSGNHIKFVFQIENKTLRTELYRDLVAYIIAIEELREKKTPPPDSYISTLYMSLLQLINALPDSEAVSEDGNVPAKQGIQRASPPSGNRVMTIPLPKIEYGADRSKTPTAIPAPPFFDTVLKKVQSTQATKYPQHREVSYVLARRLFEPMTKAVAVLTRNTFDNKPELLASAKSVRAMLGRIITTTESASKDPYLKDVAGHAVDDKKCQTAMKKIVAGFCELASALSVGNGAMLTFLADLSKGASAFNKTVKEIVAMDKTIYGEKASQMAVASVSPSYAAKRAQALALAASQVSTAGVKTTFALNGIKPSVLNVDLDDMDDLLTAPIATSSLGLPKVSFEPDQNDASLDDDYLMGEDDSEEPLNAYLDAANDDDDSSFLSGDDGELSVASASGTVVTVDLMSETLPSFVAYATASPELNLLFSPASGQLPSRWFAEYKGVPIAVAAATTVKPQLKNLFNTDGFKTAVTSALAMSRDVKAELQNLGFLPIRAQVPISHKAEAMAMARAETQVAQLQSKQQEVLNKLSERLHTAFIGLEKHFYPDTTSPLRSALVTAAAQVGVSEAKAHAMLDTALQSGAMTDHIQEAFALANRLAGMEEGVYEQHAMAIATVPYKSTQSVHAISSATKPLDMRSPAISIAAPVSAPQQPPTPTQVAIASQQQAKQFQEPDFRTPSGVLEFLTK